MKFNTARNLGRPRTALWATIVLFVCAVSGFAIAKNSGVSHPSPTGRAVVYVYRTLGLWGLGSSLDLFVNGQLRTRITDSGYYSQAVAPGTVELGMLTTLRPGAVLAAAIQNAHGVRHLYTLHAEAGRTYYLQYEIGVGSEKLVPASKEDAMKAMAGLSRFQPAQQ